MKFKSTWIAVAVFAALAAYLYFVDEPREKAKQAAQEKEGLLFAGFDPEQVTDLWLERGPRGRAHLKKDAGGQWQLLEPVADQADGGKVRNLLDDLKGLKAQREVAGADADLAAFGLREPEVSVRTAGAAVGVAVGSQNPAGDSRYVRAEGGPVKLVRGADLTGLLAEISDLRSRDVLGGFPWERLRAVEIRRPGSDRLQLAKSGEAWSIEAPIPAEADAEAVNRMLDKVRWARVESFLDGEASEPVAVPAGGVEAAFSAEGEEPPVTLRLAPAAEGAAVRAARSGRNARFTVAADVLEALRAPAESLRRRKPVLLKSWRLKAFELELSGRKLTYEKADGEWRRAGRALEGDESAAVGEYLRTLETSAATEVLPLPADPKEFALDAPWLAARFTEDAGGEQVLRVSRRDGSVFARGGDAGPVYRMAPEYAERAEAVARATEPKAPAAEGAPAAGK